MRELSKPAREWKLGVLARLSRDHAGPFLASKTFVARKGRSARACCCVDQTWQRAFHSTNIAEALISMQTWQVRIQGRFAAGAS